MLEKRQFAVMNMIFNRYSFTYFLDSVHELGVSKFELWTGVPHHYPFIETLRTGQAIKRAVKERQLEIVCVTPEQVLYPYNIASENDELRTISMEYFKRNLELTSELEVDKMLCCSGWVNFDGDREEGFERACDNLWKLASYAEREGVNLAFEVLSSFESNLANNFESTKRIMDAVDSPAMKMCVDTVAITMAGETLNLYFDYFKDRICHFHLTDGTPSGHVPLGLGNLPIREFLSQLEEYDYQGDITLEIADTQWAIEPEKATKMALQNLEAFLCQ